MIHTDSPLERARLAKNLRLGDVGEYVGRDGKTVRRWERGNCRPPARALAKLSSLYGIPATDLLMGA